MSFDYSHWTSVSLPYSTNNINAIVDWLRLMVYNDYRWTTYRNIAFKYEADAIMFKLKFKL